MPSSGYATKAQIVGGSLPSRQESNTFYPSHGQPGMNIGWHYSPSLSAHQLPNLMGTVVMSNPTSATYYNASELT